MNNESECYSVIMHEASHEFATSLTPSSCSHKGTVGGGGGGDSNGAVDDEDERRRQSVSLADQLMQSVGSPGVELRCW